MTISKRVLTKWRKEALQAYNLFDNLDHDKVKIDPLEPMLINNAVRILQMTQELLDQHLLKELNN